MTPEEYDRHYLPLQYEAARRNFYGDYARHLEARLVENVTKEQKAKIEEAIREAELAMLSEYERQMK